MISGTRVDYWRNTLVKRAFVGGSCMDSGGADTVAIQLWNPAESGKLLICDKLDVTVSAATMISLRSHNLALANLQSQGNKYLGEAAGVAQCRNVAGGMIGTVITSYELVAANLSHTFRFFNPIIIGEGLGLNFQIQTVDVDGSASFEWIEV